MVPRITEKFARFRLSIEEYYRNDENFKEIYDDYLTYFKALQFWARSDSDHASVRRSEYEKLVREMEEELTDFLVIRHGVSQEYRHSPQK